MQFKLSIERFHPTMQALLREFARKSHAANLFVYGSVHETTTDTQQKFNYRKAHFFDPRFAAGGKTGEWEHESVGTVQLIDGVFVVNSRLIKNDKYRATSPEYNTKSSKNVSKVIKTMLDSVRPFSYADIFNFHRRRMRDLVSGWRNEMSDKVSRTFDGQQDILYEEIKYLRDLGVQFKTEKFKQIAEEGIDALEEHRQRSNQALTKYHIFITDNQVSVTAVEDRPNQFTKDVPKLIYTCDGIDKLADDVLAEVSMLKMLDVGKEIRGMGVRVSERDYLVMKPLASATNA